MTIVSWLFIRRLFWGHYFDKYLHKQKLILLQTAKQRYFPDCQNMTITVEVTWNVGSNENHPNTYHVFRLNKGTK